MRGTQRLRALCQDETGQDLIEYALMAATVAVAVAGFVPYSIIPAISTIYSRLLHVANVLVPH
jgi:Flp pilus assembly pilin Flp